MNNELLSRAVGSYNSACKLMDSYTQIPFVLNNCGFLLHQATECCLRFVIDREGFEAPAGRDIRRLYSIVSELQVTAVLSDHFEALLNCEDGHGITKWYENIFATEVYRLTIEEVMQAAVEVRQLLEATISWSGVGAPACLVRPASKQEVSGLEMVMPTRDRMDAASRGIASVLSLFDIDYITERCRGSKAFAALTEEEQAQFQLENFAPGVIDDMTLDDHTVLYDACRKANLLCISVEDAAKMMGLSTEVIEMCKYYVTKYDDGSYSLNMDRWLDALFVHKDLESLPKELWLYDDEDFIKRRVTTEGIVAAMEVLSKVEPTPVDVSFYIKERFGEMDVVQTPFRFVESVLFSAKVQEIIAAEQHANPTGDAVFVVYNTVGGYQVEGQRYPIALTNALTQYVAVLREHCIDATLYRVVDSVASSAVKCPHCGEEMKYSGDVGDWVCSACGYEGTNDEDPMSYVTPF